MNSRILIVDDRELNHEGVLGVGHSQAELQALHPSDITERDLQGVDLVLVDYVLDEWASRDNTPEIAQRPLHGLALASVLRAHTDLLNLPKPTAFAVRSARLEQLCGDLPPESREHIIARANNLEWAFEKVQSKQGPPLESQIVSLASAVNCLPDVWPTDDAHSIWQLVKELMALGGDAPWQSRALEDIEECHPPIHYLSERSHGLAFLRWFLHRILPYPCFLWDLRRLAARFRTPFEELSHVVSGQSEFAKLVDSCRYRGILQDFLGPRWWGAGIESLAWELSERDSLENHEYQSKLNLLSNSSFNLFDYSRTIVCIDEWLKPLDGLFTIDEVIRIQPDDWPPFAEQAWTTLDLALKNPHLRALVLKQDLERIT